MSRVTSVVNLDQGLAEHLTLTADAEPGTLNAENPTFDHVFNILLQNLGNACSAESDGCSQKDDDFAGIESLMVASEGVQGEKAVLTPALVKCKERFQARLG